MALSFEIKEHIALLGTNSRGWTKELNLVSWNDRDPKYDIREWDENHEKMGKGVTLSKEEFKELVTALQSAPPLEQPERNTKVQENTINPDKIDVFATED